MSSNSELTWFKSSYSSASGDDCVEVAHTPTTIHIRDSKAKEGPTLTLSPTTWANFLTYTAG
ncbi:DUF397 domain-containing protein [Streptomyces diastatochromogenes]|uniref:DUF397 domain-containing protein n=1 Tax=Streptomyces diastatochromogenes TaxID=42236 RepID=A0A233SEM4_STRDA|nr:DUF397 domain-containing protein [Streptomyces diastatochromogenes]MCZ0989408.1 DUF397 domain-containing protein [Streptomyces diastatochromogenes]OXY94107.1 DUF397 domain-containing protein [Streptomyces diastatochromogenes]